MAELFNYTGGREGTHAVTLCKPVGGGVVDVENVPIDIANDWITQKGYYQCGTTGDVTPTGYCTTTPVGNDCETPPQPAPPALAVSNASNPPEPSICPNGDNHAPCAITMQPAAHTLPTVGVGGAEIWVALIIAVVITALMYGRKRANA